MRTSQAGIDPDAPGLTGRIGGPLGRHARVAGVWFDPVPWAFGAALVTWFFTVLKQVRCLGNDPAALPNAASRLCYSDISVLYRSYDSIWTGGPLYGGTQPLEYPVLSGGLIWVTRWLTRLLGGDVSPTADAAARLHASDIFLGLNAVLLFCCFLALVWAHLQMGRRSASAYTDGVRVRSWDALFLAASPLVIAVGIINWDMFAVALTALAVLAWARRRPLIAGLLLGLACSAKFFPLAVVAVLFILCLRAAAWWTYTKFITGVVMAWLAANVPLALTNPDGWKYFYTYNATRGADYGSVWYVLSLIGLPVGSVPLTIAEVALVALAGAGIVTLVLTAPRRPRLGQVALLVLVAFMIINKVYSPQYVLWLLPFVILARPVILDVAIFSAGELAYFFAVFGFIGRSPGDQGLPDPLYWAMVALRIGVEIWIAMRVLDDILRPWQDPVRTPLVDDPIGGVLDHAADAPFLLRAAARRPAVRAVAPAHAALPEDAAFWPPPSPVVAEAGSVPPSVIEPEAPAGVPSVGTVSPAEEVLPVDQTPLAEAAPPVAAEAPPITDGARATRGIAPAARGIAPAGEVPLDDDLVIEPGTVLNRPEHAEVAEPEAVAPEAEPGAANAVQPAGGESTGAGSEAVSPAHADVPEPATESPAKPAATGLFWNDYESWMADLDQVLGPRKTPAESAAAEALVVSPETPGQVSDEPFAQMDTPTESGRPAHALVESAEEPDESSGELGEPAAPTDRPAHALIEPGDEAAEAAEEPAEHGAPAGAPAEAPGRGSRDKRRGRSRDGHAGANETASNPAEPADNLDKPVDPTDEPAQAEPTEPADQHVEPAEPASALDEHAGPAKPADVPAEAPDGGRRRRGRSGRSKAGPSETAGAPAEVRDEPAEPAAESSTAVVSVDSPDQPAEPPESSSGDSPDESAESPESSTPTTGDADA